MISGAFSMGAPQFCRGRRGGVSGWSKYVGRVSERPLLVISVVFGVGGLKRRYFADFGRVFDGSAAILSGAPRRSVGGGHVMRAWLNRA